MVAEQNALATLEQATQLLAKVKTIPDAKHLVDLAAAAQEYAKRQKLGTDAEMHAAEIRLRATRRLGEILQESDRKKGAADGTPGPGRGHKVRQPLTENALVSDEGVSTAPPSIEELGLTYDESSRAQRLARLDEEVFEERVSLGRDAGELSFRNVFKPKPHVSQSTGEIEWYTPPEIIEAVRDVLGKIDLDPASTAAANKIVKAKKFYTTSDDGLRKPWGGCVWLNPPYSIVLIQQFVTKLIDEWNAGRVSDAIVITNNATETSWGQTLLTNCDAVCFLSGRVQFLSPEGIKNTPLQGQMICYFGLRVVEFAAVFSLMGTCFCQESKGASSVSVVDE